MWGGRVVVNMPGCREEVQRERGGGGGGVCNQ